MEDEELIESDAADALELARVTLPPYPPLLMGGGHTLCVSAHAHRNGIAVIIVQSSGDDRTVIPHRSICDHICRYVVSYVEIFS